MSIDSGTAMSSRVTCTVLPLFLALALLRFCSAHVSLTFPPARLPDYDFLDNVRTGGPCGVPDDNDGLVTTFKSGATFNVTYHLAYPHRGGILLNILAPNGTILYALLGMTWHLTDDTTRFHHEVTLPEGFECERCTLQLIRQAAEWTAPVAQGYVFWSCADIAIVNSTDAVCNNKTCSGHGRCEDGECVCDRLYSGEFCQNKDECAEDSDCSNRGSCMDIGGTSLPRRQCFCSVGWHGKDCGRESLLKDASIDPTEYKITRQLSERLVLYARIVKDELEVALKHNGTGYVALGWRAPGQGANCRANAPGLYPLDTHILWRSGQAWPMVDGADTYYQELVGVIQNGSGEGASEEGASEEGGSEEGGSEEGGSEEGGSEEGGSEEGGSEEGGSEEGGSEEGDDGAHPMDCTDIVIGMARGTKSRVFDYFTRDRATPRRDEFYGGQDSITAAVGKEEDGYTYIKWRRKLTTDDPTADYAITDTAMHVIWSFGQVYPDYYHWPGSGIEAGTAQNGRFYVPDELKYHGTRNRGATTINFFDIDQGLPEDRCKGGFSTGCGGPSGVCDYQASWTVHGDSVTFNVSARTSSEDTQWVAIGFSDDRFMPLSDAVVGAADDNGFFVTDRYITARAPPPVDKNQDISDVWAIREDGVTTMTFTRPRKSQDDLEDISLEQCRYFLFGWRGPADVSSGSIGYHPQTPIVSTERICVPSPEECPGPVLLAEGGAEGVGLSLLVLLPGVLSALAAFYLH